MTNRPEKAMQLADLMKVIADAKDTRSDIPIYVAYGKHGFFLKKDITSNSVIGTDIIKGTDASISDFYYHYYSYNDDQKASLRDHNIIPNEYNSNYLFLNEEDATAFIKEVFIPLTY